MKLGSKENPCMSNYDINKIIRGMQNCNIYTIKTFIISDENLEQTKARNIKFVGLNVAYLKYSTIKIPRIPIYSDKIIRQMQIAIDESISKTAQDLKNKYINMPDYEEQMRAQFINYGKRVLGEFNK